jgi:hypothetical protein
MAELRIHCDRHGNQPAYVTRNKNAYCPMCLIQGHSDHIKEATGAEGHPRVMHPPMDYSKGRDLMRVLEAMHEVLHPYGEPEHEWDVETTTSISELVYSIIRPKDDSGVYLRLGPALRELHRHCDVANGVIENRLIRQSLQGAMTMLEEDVQLFDDQHIVLQFTPPKTTPPMSKEEWLRDQLMRLLGTEYDGCCMDNSEERGRVATGIAKLLMKMAR